MSVLKKQKRYYSGKKKRHTLKTQLLVSLLTGEIIALAFSNGQKHDFQLFKDSGIHAKAETVLEADTGYQGLAQIHANSLLPKKRSKHHPLTRQERKENREISRKLNTQSVLSKGFASSPSVTATVETALLFAFP